MAMFLGHVAFMFELAVFVAGLALWHFGRQGAASALRTGALIAVIGATLSALCTGYYLVRYSVQGDLDHAYPIHAGMSMREMMGQGGMGGMMKGGGMMGGGGAKMGEMREGRGETPPPAGETPDTPDHEKHHPGGAAQ
jgi:hypothetical protein